MNSSDFQYDALCIQETWLHENIETGPLKIKGYNLITKNRTCGKHGGLAIYLKQEYEYTDVVVSCRNDTLWEYQKLEIILNSSKKQLRLINIYRPPRNLSEEQEQFLEELEVLLNEIDQDTAMTMIVDDFNINLLKIENNNFAKTFFDNMLSYSSIPIITMPTRISGNHGILIDNIFLRSNTHTLEITGGIINSNISDHLPIFIAMNKITQKSPRFIKIYKYNNKSIKLLRDALCQTDFDTLLDFDTNESVDKNCYKLLETLGHEMKKYIPITEVKFDRRKHKNSKWITTGLIKSINYRDKLYSKLKKTKVESEKYQSLKINLKTYNNILKRAIKEAKTNYYDYNFTKKKNDSKKCWTMMKC